MEKQENIKRNYLAEILDILSSDKTNLEKHNLLTQYHESDIAEVLDDLNDDDRKKLYEILDTETLGEVILYSDDIEEIVSDIEPQVLADIIESMDADDAIDVLEELDEESAKAVVELILHRLCLNHCTVNSAKAYGLAAAALNKGNKVLVGFARKHHLHNLCCFLIGISETVYEF